LSQPPPTEFAAFSGSGGSVGREGPIIQVGAAFGSTLGQLVAMSARQRALLIAAGTGGGIAATFNTPIGGIVFAVRADVAVCNPPEPALGRALLRDGNLHRPCVLRRPALLLRISASLAGDETRQNRLRTTLAHEYGHVRFHAYLWDLEPPDPDLLKSNPNVSMQICYCDNILDAAQTDWMKWQAGYVCGALLMPASKVRELAGANLESQGLFDLVGQRDSHGLALIESSNSPTSGLNHVVRTHRQ
jgi:Voltage gated chloride channel